MVTANTNFSNCSPSRCRSSAPAGFRLATFTDRDVILVRSSSLRRGRIALGTTQNHTYQVQLPVNVAGNPIDVPRGWSAVDVTVRGRTIRFANTPPRGLRVPGTLKDQIRNPQSEELAAALKASPYPVVLVGDINARPTMCNGLRTTPPNDFLDQNVMAYENLTSAGLLEVWPLVYPSAPCGSAGWTSGQSTLDNAASTLDHRIDDVFVSAGFTALEADVVGDRQADRTAGRAVAFGPRQHLGEDPARQRATRADRAASPRSSTGGPDRRSGPPVACGGRPVSPAWTSAW